MECYICLAEKSLMERQIQSKVVTIQEAVFAVKEDGELRLLCVEHMAEFYGMHETVLVPGDTYVPHDNEE